MTDGKYRPKIQEVDISWWDAEDGRGTVSEIRAYAESPGTEEEAEATVPLLKQWFESKQIDVQAFEKDLLRMLHGCV